MAETKRTTKAGPTGEAASSRKGKATTAQGASFTAAEREAMKERAREVKAEGRRASRAEKAAEAERQVLEKIAEMPPHDRVLAERIHAIVKEQAPSLTPRTWYGMPAYAKDGKILCFFQGAAKFDTRYATLGFNDTANLDDGTMWPTAFAVTELSPAVQRRIADLVTQAAG